MAVCRKTTGTNQQAVRVTFGVCCGCACKVSELLTLPNSGRLRTSPQGLHDRPLGLICRRSIHTARSLGAKVQRNNRNKVALHTIEVLRHFPPPGFWQTAEPDIAALGERYQRTPSPTDAEDVAGAYEDLQPLSPS
jgi:hypothetical protein